MNEIPPVVPQATPPRLVASLRHTIILIVILLTIAAYGVVTQHVAAEAPPSASRGSKAPLYLVLLVAEWALVRYVAVGLRRAGTPFRELLGRRWASVKDVARDAVIAIVVFALWTAGASVVERMIHGTTPQAVTRMLPEGPLEIGIWILLSLSAGFCEEVVYRGYLQQQFQALTGSALAGIAIQAVIFGVSHGYQGLRNVAFITVYGALFGALAAWRKSLKPGMILHAWTDVFGGLIQRG